MKSIALSLIWVTSLGATAPALYFVTAKAKTSFERTAIANLGIAIDAVFSDSVAFIANEEDILSIKEAKIDFEIMTLPDRSFDFPSKDSEFHDYSQTLKELEKISADHPDIATRVMIGKSVEGKDLAGVRISGNRNHDSLPTAIFLGCHHAREHLSVEVPLRLARYLTDRYSTDKKIKGLIDTREIWIIPMVNPDGAEYDIATGQYRYWRKNRRSNGSGSFGVDLNRNYEKGFGGPGSSNNPSSDIYHGPQAFSEPETSAIRDFVRARKRATVLLTFHTFSELVLWPWGHTYDQVPKENDKKVFETMGYKMADWNHYKAEKASDLYLASGDTTDWAYSELGIFAFTFELTPSSMFGGGFYPGAQAIEPTLKANIEPALYLIEKAENPYSVIRKTSSDPLGVL